MTILGDEWNFRIDGSIGGGESGTKVGRLHLVLLGEAPWLPPCGIERTWSPKNGWFFEGWVWLKQGWNMVEKSFKWGVCFSEVVIFTCVAENSSKFQSEWPYFSWAFLIIEVTKDSTNSGFIWYMDMLPCHDHNEYMNIFVRLRDDFTHNHE